MKKNIVAFASALANGDEQPTVGVPCVIIMWDGAPAFVTGVNGALQQLGYSLKNVASFGFSRGEDKFMGPAEWKDNPELMKGKTILGYIGDGDWNIAMTFLSNNKICNNPDRTSYDPNCVNWIDTADHIDAVQKYITGYCEDRKIVGDFKTKHICGDAVVTWTPGDVMIAKQTPKDRPGLVSILSTFENFWQMPSAMLVIDRYAEENRSNIEGIIDAGLEGGAQIATDDKKLREATKLVAVTYNEQDADYWYKYYTIQQEKNTAGQLVPLGGSYSNNLGDNLFIMGLANDSENLLVTVYDTFGKLFTSQYPDRMDSFVPGEQVVDTSFIKNISMRQKKTNKVVPEAEKPQITQSSRIKQKLADKSYSIEFDTGKATFTPAAEATLKEVLSALTVSGGLAVKIIGHTDNTGNPKANVTLSEKRAFAVRDWLRDHGKGMPNIENAKASGVGQTEPLVPNDSAANMAKNRRVQIVLGSIN
jgi:outer membrane protein OmpA-like peptidoglycan-associated protein